MHRLLSLLTTFVLLCGGARAADWPQFRGPHGTGFSEDAALAGRLEVPQSFRWKAALPGRGVSSPIVVGERVFLTCSSGPRQERLHVVCFDARDGSIRWERQFSATGRTMCHDKTAVAAPTPASDRQRVYALFSSSDLFCLDHEGNLVWLRGLSLDYRNANNSLGMASSPWSPRASSLSNWNPTASRWPWGSTWSPAPTAGRWTARVKPIGPRQS